MALRPLAGVWAALAALVVLAGEPPAEVGESQVLIQADLFARQEPNILYAIGNVRLRRGNVVISADAAVIWETDREAYLEGNVIYRTGKSSMRAQRAYVHWTKTTDPETGQERQTIDRGFLFRADVRWNERPDAVPWHIRAEEVLQMDLKHFKARGGVVLSPCTFAKPHAFFRASEVELISDERLIVKDVGYYVRGVSLPPMWVPPIYWPRLSIPLGWRWPDVRFDVGSSSRLGTYVLSEVTYKLPSGFVSPKLDTEVGVRLDYYSDRGGAYGGVFRYELEGEPRGVLGRRPLWGEISGYHVTADDGKDQDEFELGTRDRWRVKFIHSQDLPEGLEFDIEFQRYSDAAFRYEFFEDEFEREKPIENRIYLKYARGPFALYFHYKWRENEWLDVTEYQPQIGANVFSFPLWGNLLYTGHIEIARVRRRLSELRLAPGELPTDASYLARRRRWNYYFLPDESLREDWFAATSTMQEFLSDDRRFWRFDTYHQLSLPFSLWIFEVEPFVGTRQTWYEETLMDTSDRWRGMFVYGGRISTQVWRAWDDVRVDQPLLQIDGLRHIITPEVRVLNIEKPTLTPDELIMAEGPDFLQPIRNYRFPWPWLPYRPYDTVGLAFGDVDTVWPVRVVNIGLRNRWQTRRNGRVVDFLDLDARVDFYPREDRDNFGTSWSDFELETRFSPISGVKFYNSFLYRFSDPLATGIGNVDMSTGLLITTSRRWQLLLTHRYLANLSNRFGAEVIYHLSRKWRVGVRAEFESEDNGEFEDTDEFEVRLTRDLHDWIAEFVFETGRGGLRDLVGFRLRPKTRRELVHGLVYTRALGYGLDERQRMFADFED